MNTRQPYLYGTHLPALIEWCFKTDGPVLEIGAGSFSTPVLGYILDNRTIVTVEPTEEWRTKFEEEMPLSTSMHYFVSTLEEAFKIERQYDVILFDGPMPRDLKTVKDHGKIIVVHDTNDPQYGYDFSSFRYRVDYKDLYPFTTVLSDEQLYEDNLRGLQVDFAGDLGPDFMGFGGLGSTPPRK